MKTISPVQTPVIIAFGTVTNLKNLQMFEAKKYMAPMMEVELIITDVSKFDLEQQKALATLLYESDKIYINALILHIIYGAIAGFVGGCIMHEDYKGVKRIGGFW